MALGTTHTTQAEMESIFGVDAILMRVDDNDSDSLESTETTYLEDVIDEATVELETYLIHRYALATITASTWARRACAYIAIHILSQRRGDPGQYCDRYTHYLEQLTRIRDGKGVLPRSGTRHEEGALMSNLVVDDRHARAKLRVQPDISESDHPDQDRDRSLTFDI